MKEIKLTQGKVALVDDCNYEWLNQWKWCLSGSGYAIRRSPTVNGNQGVILMHRLIMNTPDDKETDHKNGIGWDNRKNNLRIVNRSQNMMNRRSNKNTSSKYKGVCWHRRNRRWCAKVSFNRKQIHLGCFTCEKEAALAYNRGAKELFGEFARLNFK